MRNKVNSKIRAVIIGAGNIGAWYDNPASKNILTHAHGYAKHPRLTLVGFIDKDLKKARQASRVWGGRAYSSIKDFFARGQCDIVSVCVPDQEHYQVFSELKKYKIQGGIIEKPLTHKLEYSRQLVGDSFFKKHHFIVNYSRRFVPEFQKLAGQIKGGQWGKFLCGCGWYGKGLLHNGSHLFDLLSFFGINFTKTRIVSRLVDFTPSDPSYSLLASRSQRYFFNLQAVPASHYDIFELDLIFSQGRVKILDGGSVIEEYGVGESPLFANDKNLKLTRRYQTKLNQAMYFTVDNLAQAIAGRAKPLCTIQDAYKAQRFCQL